MYLDLHDHTEPRLSTHPITDGQKTAGRLLAAFELLLDKVKKIDLIPGALRFLLEATGDSKQLKE